MGFLEKLDDSLHDRTIETIAPLLLSSFFLSNLLLYLYLFINYPHRHIHRIEMEHKNFRLEKIDLSCNKKGWIMGLDRELEAMRRRLNRIAPIKSPPELKMNIYSEAEWNNKKPTSKSQWEIDLVIEEKRPLM